MLQIIGLFFVLILFWWFIRYETRTSSRPIIRYFIEGSGDFKPRVIQILSRSNWNLKYQLQHTEDRSAADAFIYLASRDEMNKWHRTPKYYPSGKQIRFSITTQSPWSKPQIYIDEINWRDGVKESGLSLKEYQEYVINHEFGHALGFDHVTCDVDKRSNNTCPVMYQSTRGCPSGVKCGMQVSNVDFQAARIPEAYDR